MDPTMILNNTIGLAKAAKAFEVPTVLTTVTSDRGGKLPQAIQAVFPDQVPIDRTTLNSWEDSRVVDAVKKTGRKKIIFAALWTEICLAFPAIHAMGDGYDVYVVTDASGGVSIEAHDRAIQRLVQAGAVPVTWMGVLSEWQRDWAREATVPAVAEIMFAHGGATGTSIAWEFQLLHAASQKK
jgi:nicotinamidase-related amidase